MNLYEWMHFSFYDEPASVFIWVGKNYKELSSSFFSQEKECQTLSRFRNTTRKTEENQTVYVVKDLF